MINWVFGLIKKYWQFIKFCIVGGFNTIADFLVLNLFLYLNTNSNLAWTFGVIAGAICSYLCNRFWVFKHVKSNTKKTLPRFILTFGIFLLITLSFRSLLMDKAGFSDNIAKLISIPFTTMINYFLSKLFTFREKKDIL